MAVAKIIIYASNREETTKIRLISYHRLIDKSKATTMQCLIKVKDVESTFSSIDTNYNKFVGDGCRSTSIKELKNCILHVEELAKILVEHLVLDLHIDGVSIF